MRQIFEKFIGRKESPIGRDRRVKRIGGYSVVRKIGSGGTSDVYLALDAETLAAVAIKRLRPQCDSGLHRQMFATESRLCGRLVHPGVIALHRADTADAGGAHLVMEHVEGHALDRYEDTDTLLPPETVADVMRQTAEAMHYLDRMGIIHRDLKPGNILMRHDGLIKIVDFGCAIVEGYTPPGLRIAGSLPYMSPEQVAGRPLSTLADMYSLGALSYRLLTGHHPLEQLADETPQAYAKKVMTRRPQAIETYRRDIPSALSGVVVRMLNKHPGDRFESWRHLIQALEAPSAPGIIEKQEAAQMRFALPRRWHTHMPDRTLSFGL